MGKIQESIIDALGAVAIVLTIPLFLLNFSSGIVGGIWLLILGKWKLVLIGFGLTVFFPALLFSLILLPGTGISLLGMKLGQRGIPLFPRIIGFIGSFINYCIIAFWILIIVTMFVRQSDGHNLVPFLLFGYSTAMFPLSYMAKYDGPDATGTMLAMLFAQIYTVIFCFVGIMIERMDISSLINLLLLVGFPLFHTSIGLKMNDGFKNKSKNIQ